MELAKKVATKPDKNVSDFTLNRSEHQQKAKTPVCSYLTHNIIYWSGPFLGRFWVCTDLCTRKSQTGKEQRCY